MNSATQVDVEFNDINPAALIAIHVPTTDSKTLFRPVIALGFKHKLNAESNMSLRGEVSQTFYDEIIDYVSGG